MIFDSLINSVLTIYFLRIKDVQYMYLMFSSCRLLMWFISVSRFFYIDYHRLLVFPFEWFYTSHSLVPLGC